MRSCKVILCLLLMTAMLVGLIPQASAAGYATGDVDNSREIDSIDALIILQYNVGIEKLNEPALTAADVDASGEIDAVDSLWILQKIVGSVPMFPADLDEKERYYYNRSLYYKVAEGEDFVDHNITDIEDVQKLLDTVGIEPEPSDIENYSINQDSYLVYTPISNGARKLGTINKYKNADKVTGTLELEGATFQYSVPTDVTAYDAVPITYTMYSTESNANDPWHISATTFEEPDRYQDKNANYYDCNMPGKIDIEMTYNGYMVGTIDESYNPNWSSKDFNDKQGTQFPQYDLDDKLIKSGTVSSKNDYTWFNFSFKNVGNTILDSVGNGAFSFFPVLQRKNPNTDQYENVTDNTNTDNLMKRVYDYMYPGESSEMWLLFVNNHVEASQGRYRMKPGDYRIIIYTQLRSERTPNGWASGYVGGRAIAHDILEFNVTEEGEMTTPKKLQHEDYGAAYARNEWIGSYEEFQSSYNTHRTISSDKNNPTTGTIYVQPAPWDSTLSLKIMPAGTPSAKMVRIPLNVESDSIKIELNPYNENYHIKEDGTREPLLITQNMADMRGNSQDTPYAREKIVNVLKDMKDAGINMVTSTMAFGYTPNNESYKFSMDVTRALGLDFEGFSHYTYHSGVASAQQVKGSGIGGTLDTWGMYDVNEANAILADYSFQRYGDMYYQDHNGIIPIATEDTWGWLTMDHDWRFGLHQPKAITQFQDWLQGIYGSIDKLNQAYNSSYTDFSEVDPREGAKFETMDGGSYIFIDSIQTYTERSRAVAELDVYRTLGRVKNYKTMLENLKTLNPDKTKVWVRYEGSTWFAPGIDPNTKNTHYRQTLYEQRRNAVIPEILSASGVVYGGSNYDGTPLTPSETYELTKRSADAGLIMSKVPMTTHMRDVVINPYYGDGKYVQEYNLADTNLKGAWVDTTMALFPFFKAMYEGGGIPGVMWQDYFCDGFATATQFKEAQFYTKKIQEMLSTEEGKKWATDFDPADRSFEEDIAKTWSYPKEYIDKVVKETPRYNMLDKPYVKK